VTPDLPTLCDQLETRFGEGDYLLHVEQDQLLRALREIADAHKRRDEIMDGRVSAEVVRLRTPPRLAVVDGGGDAA
jgi:hypothetical protein